MAPISIKNETKDEEGAGNIIRQLLSNLSAGGQKRGIEEEPIESVIDWELLPDFKATRENVWGKRKLGLTWKGLTIKGTGADGNFHENIISQFLPKKMKRRSAVTENTVQTIINKSHGCVKPGEMLLVLGRPGAGCTTLLKVLGNKGEGYTSIEGQINYGSLGVDDIAHYQGQIVMNMEEETFFPTLTASETIDFATRLKVPYHSAPGYDSPEEARIATRDFFFHLLSVSHTAKTKIGNEFIRGVSGGERKRISILEAMTTRGSVYFWDNSTRGLDANTALQFVTAVRKLTDIFGLTSILTLYQAGNEIYKLFDKVLVLERGDQIYYGPMKESQPFMEQLGFICMEGSNVADFLTGVTVPTERKIRTGYEERFPKNAREILQQYENSELKRRMELEYNYPETLEAKNHTMEFKRAVELEKHPDIMMGRSPVTVGLGMQIKACVQRQYQILRGDMAAVVIKQASNIIQALLSGSLFYSAPSTSTGMFLKSGALFVSLLFNCLLAMAEVTESFVGRPVLAKHKSFALYHPVAFCLAQILLDIPIQLFQISTFSLVVYFMVGLTSSADAFFTFWFILLTATICMTALFRAIGAGFKNFDDASQASGFAIITLLLYNGYMIPKSQMHPWFVWIFWIDPLAYAFDALLSNEFHDKVIPCTGPNLVPNGPSYDSSLHQACTGVQGALPGATNVTGAQYLESLSYNQTHIWRNIGIIWAWWALFVVLTVVATTLWKETTSQNGLPAVPRELVKNSSKIPSDEEAQDHEKVSASSIKSPNENDLADADRDLVRHSSIFTWRNLTYTVDTTDGPRRLLRNINGWVKPGMLGALMGASGAGKTTLLDVLAQRKTDGTINGSILVDGRPLSISFQRSTGYCEQVDVHEPLATVREALEFSALLRQPRTVSRKEKLAYVDVIMDLLEMHDIADCLVGTTSDGGLSIEQRKRLTIGVELVAKPRIMIFLDEPTSGLDGQAAYNIVRFLKKLSAAGQAILVTIHQPSAQLFYQFDTLLLLARGGNTVYFGDIGDKASAIKDYLGRHGAHCPPDRNPAEYMIDVVSDHKGDWPKIWLDSPEHDAVLAELDRMTNEVPTTEHHVVDDDFEFAMPLWEQCKIVTIRLSKAMYRNAAYVNNKFAFHVITGLFTGFSFWKVGNGVGDLQLRLFAVFNFIFVAPGVIAQLQPLFIEKRDIYDAREKKAKVYSWKAFVTGLIVSELPYLVICAVLFYVCFYYTVGLPGNSSQAGSVFFVMLMYEFLYTGIGQFIAAYAPNAVAASLVNPLILFTLVGYCGALVPYSQITSFWRYWLYYLNPFTYLMGSLLVFTTYDLKVQCKPQELAIFDPLENQTCVEYLNAYLEGMGSGSNLLNPSATSNCQVCQYSHGSDYLQTLNLKKYYYGWRDAAIVVIFVFSSYAMVYLLMKLRTKKSKKSE